MSLRSRLFNLGRRVTNAVIGGITEGWDLYISENTGTPLNTSNYLNVTLTTVLDFNTLTGIELLSYEGTAVISKSGSDLICTTGGNLTQLTFDNGEIIDVNQGNGNVLVSRSGGFGCYITNGTWVNGDDTIGEQLSITPRNSYDYFSGNNIDLGSGTDLTGKTVSMKVLPYAASGTTFYENTVIAGTGLDSKGLRVTHGNSLASIIVGISTAGVEKRYIYTMPTSEGKSSVVDISITMNDYATGDATVYVNGNLVALGSNGNALLFRAGHRIGSRGDGLIAMEGIIQMTIDGVDYNTFNNWQGETVSGTQPVKSTFQVIEGSDVFGNAEILPPALIGYNFTGQDLHHYDTATVVDNSGASSFGVWAEMTNKGREQLIFNNDVVSAKINTSGIIEVTVNGTTMAGVTALDAGVLYYAAFSTDGAGVGKIYLGDETNAMVLDATGTVGVGAVSSSNLILGSSTTVPINGLVAQFNHYPLELNLAQHENNRQVTKKKIVESNNSLPYILPFNL